jgi:hypothetical protein
MSEAMFHTHIEPPAKMIVFIFFESGQEEKRFCTE